MDASTHRRAGAFLALIARPETKSSIRSPINESNTTDVLGRPSEKEAHDLRSGVVPLVDNLAWRPNVKNYVHGDEDHTDAS